MAKQSKSNLSVRWIPVSEIGIVWPEAQRDVTQSHVNRIAENFDPDALGVIQVAEKNGKGLYHPIDGQHRIAALRQMGYDDQLVRAEVHDIHNAKEAAEKFRTLNTVKKQSILDAFRIGVTAGEAGPCAINRIVKGAGYRVGISDSTRSIAAVGALNEIHRKYGEAVLAQTLRTLTAIWRDDPDAKNSVVLRGIGNVIGTYGDALDISRMREKIGKKFSAANLIAAAKHHKQIAGTNETLGAMTAIVVEYNKGMRPDGRLPIPQ